MSSSSAGESVEAFLRKWRTLWAWSHLYFGFKAAQAKSRILVDDVERREFWDRKHSQFAGAIWSNIRDLRGWWVKVGQFMSTRSDLLPRQYISELVKLQDAMPCSDYKKVKQTVQDELGCSIEEIFSSFDETPIASASIGQVHRAVLREGCIPVAVKVQHPDVERLLTHDMHTLTQMTWAFGFLERGLDVGPILDEWQRAAALELNFKIELGHQERARLALWKSGINVKVPKCFPKLTTKKILVMEFSPGFKVTDMEMLEYHKVDKESLMLDICRSFAYQIHIDGMFNADPHPGNILVEVDSAGVATPVLIDWGLVKNFSLDEREAFARTVVAVANLDVMGLMAAFEEMGFKFSTTAGFDPEVYMDAIRLAFFADSGGKHILNTNESRNLQKAEKKKIFAQKNPIDDWPKDIIFFIRVVSLLHGLCLQLNTKIPFLQILLHQAEICLIDRYRPLSDFAHSAYRHVGTGPNIFNKFEFRVKRLASKLFDEGTLLGGQVVVLSRGRTIADVSVGRMGPVDSRPVTSQTLFCGGSLCVGLLGLSILLLVESGDLGLDDRVCEYWDGFIRFGKENITIRQILNHTAGFGRALPADLTLALFTDYQKMIKIFENFNVPSVFAFPQYAYLTAGWLFSEIIQSATGMHIEEFVYSRLFAPLDLTKNCFFPMSHVDSERRDHRQMSASRLRSLDVDSELLRALAVEGEFRAIDLGLRKNLTAERLATYRRDFGGGSRVSPEEVMAKMKNARAALGTDEADRIGTSKFVKSVKVEVRVSGLELGLTKPHVVDPKVLDSRKIWPILIPPTNGRFTALGLAQLFSSVLGMLSDDLLEKVRQSADADNSIETVIATGGSSRIFGLGLQLFPLDSTNGRQFVGLGHSDVSGSLVVCIPEMDVTVCILVNDVLEGPATVGKLLDLIWSKFSLTPKWRDTVDLGQLLGIVERQINLKLEAKTR